MSSPPIKRAIVLVVEDEPLLRMAATRLVEDAGFEAVDAANADDAIRILETRNDIHIVFTDIDMPGATDGLKLAAAVRGRWPPIRIILTSGHRVVNASDLPRGSLFLAKPYSNRDVVAALQQMAA